MQPPDKKLKLKEVLTRERNRRGISQQEVADTIGASLRNYQRWEGGETFPQSHYWRRLQKFFGSSLDEVTVLDPREHRLQGQPIPTGTSSHEKQTDQSSSATSSPTDERKAETPPNRHRIPPASEQERKHTRYKASAILLILVLAIIGIGFLLQIAHPFPSTPIKPGGAWISPSGKTIGDVIHFAAYAYPTNKDDPEIDHVNFTVHWQGVDPRKWIIACVARRPIRKDVFACDVDLRKLGAPVGQILVSFDVYDRQGNVNFAPNGEHTLIYSPGT